MTADDCLDRECERLLYREAELLDARKFDAWLALLHPGIDYRVPVRTTREKKEGEGFSDRAFFMEEDYGSLKLRVARFASDFAWSENPPTRTRRLVANVRLRDAEPGEPGQVVLSNLAVYCHRGEVPAPLVLTGERQDLWRRGEGGWKLYRRLVLLDTTILGMESLSIFL